MWPWRKKHKNTPAGVPSASRPKIVAWQRSVRRRVFELTLIATGALAISIDSPVLWLLPAAASIAAWILRQRRRVWLQPPIPNPRSAMGLQLVQLAIVVATGAFFVELLTGQIVIVAVAHYLTAILSAKLFELHTPRDVAVHLVLTLLAAILTVIVGLSLLCGLLVIYYFIRLFRVCMDLRTEQSLEQLLTFYQSRRLGGDSSEALLDALPTTAYLSPRRARRRALSGLCILVGLSALVSFFFFPRGVKEELRGSWNTFLSDKQVGFSDQVRLGDVIRIRQSDRVVMRVSLKRGGRPFGTRGYHPLLRGIVLDRYQNGVWTRSETEQVSAPESWRYDPTQIASILGQIELSAVCNQPMKKYLFAPLTPQTCEAGTRLNIFPTPMDHVIRLPNAGGGTRHYTVHSDERAPEWIDPNSSYAMTPWDASNRIWELAVQWASAEGRRRLDLWKTYCTKALKRRNAETLKHRFAEAGQTDTGELARIEQELASLDRRIADRFAEKLAEQCRYTDQVPSSSGLDPIEFFLFEHRKGHCEYFAAAFVGLCRAVGIRARVVAGYRPTEYSALGGFYTVRQRCAHSWAEVYLPGHYWISYDPTPPHDDPPTTELGLWTFLLELLGAVEYRWLGGLIRYDSAGQSALLQKGYSWLAGHAHWILDVLEVFWDGLESAWQLLTEQARARRWLLILILCGLPLAGAVGAVVVLHRRKGRTDNFPAHKSVKRRFFGVSASLRRVRLYRQILTTLARRGYHRDGGQTPLEFARRLRDRRPELFAELPEIMFAFYRLRFAGIALSSQEVRRIRHFIGRIS